MLENSAVKSLVQQLLRSDQFYKTVFETPRIVVLVETNCSLTLVSIYLR